MIRAVASHQVRSLTRQRTFQVALGVLGAMTALAGVLGWSSHHTIVAVYDQATILLQAEGGAAPPNPFLLKPTLSLLSNLVVYIPLIGALLALVVGHLSLADDQVGGVGRLLFSRPLDRRRYLVGKIVAAAVVLAGVLTGSLVISAAALLLVNRTLAPADLARLVGFFALSWLYLLVFALVGMAAVTLSRRRSLGLSTALGTWLVVTFVVPQLTSALRPTASLNPLAEPVGTSQTFFRLTALGRPVSIAEQYREASARILATAPPDPTIWHGALRIAPIAGASVLLTGALLVLVQRHDFSRSATDA